MPNIIKLKGSEFTAPTDLANANTAFDSTVVKAYHSSALTVNFLSFVLSIIFKNNFSKMSILTKNSLNFSNPHSKRKSLSNLSPIKKLSPDFGILFLAEKL